MERPVCPVCGRHSAESLETHLSMHGPELARTLAIIQADHCIVCGSRASLEPSMENHLWVHHSKKQLITALLGIVRRHEAHQTEHCVLCGLERQRREVSH